MIMSAFYWLTHRRIALWAVVGGGVAIALVVAVFASPLESSSVGERLTFADNTLESGVAAGSVAPDSGASRHSQSSSSITLIGNLGQASAPASWEPIGPEDGIVYVQAIRFTTGSNPYGYSLSAVKAWIKDVGSNDDPQVNIYSADDDGFPDEILYTLTDPNSFTDSAVNTFTAPANSVLGNDTEYYLVLENAADVSGTTFYYAGFVDGNALDSNGAAGWSINTDEDYTVLFKIEGSLATSYSETSSSQSGISTVGGDASPQGPALGSDANDVGKIFDAGLSGADRRIAASHADGRTPKFSWAAATTSQEAKNHITNNVVKEYEDDYPWVRQAWSNQPLNVRVRSSNAPGWYVFYMGGHAGFRGLARGIRYGFTESGLRSDTVVLHELAHHFTLDTRVPNVQDAVGVGWLYFNHRVNGDCPVGEIYADVLAYVTRDNSNLRLGYIASCPEIGSRGKPDSQSRNVVKKVVRGEIPDWFENHYDDGSGEIDLDSLWGDIRTASGKRTIVYLLRDKFGGYCSTGEANWALTHADAVGGNPWRDGGCESRKPQDVNVIQQDGGLKVTWEPHLYEASPEVTHYAVQWRSADQDYHSSRQTLISNSSELSHTISGLTDGVEHHVRVVAVNSESTDSTVDEHGHSRAAEASSVPGQPGRPAFLGSFPSDHTMVLIWGVPENSEVDLSGYVVEWKSGSQEYDSTRRLEVPVGLPTNATISELLNSTNHTFRVTAQSSGGLAGVPAEVTASPIGPPEMPLEVEAVGGRNSLLVSWEPDLSQSPPDAYVIQWRTRADYEPGNEKTIWAPFRRSHALKDMAGHGRYYVRVLARNYLGRSEPSEEFFVMSGAPHEPSDFNVEVRPGGGFEITWDRPEPYYPDNPDFRPVRNFNNKRPILDSDGSTVPQYRYDVEYRLAGDPPGPWCSQSRYRDVAGRNDNLDPVPHRLEYLRFCADSEPVVGESYKFRIRAAYVWKQSGDTNVRNGPWAYTDRVLYDPSGGPPDTPTGVEAVGGKASLLVSWDTPISGTAPDDYLIQWRTRANYESGNNAVSSNPVAGLHLINRMAGHGRYYVRIIARNVLGESEPSQEYFVMSGAPHAPADVDTEVRDGGGFTVTWDRPDPYYPDNPDFRPVRNFNNKRPILDSDGSTVPQYRYDVEYKLADGEPGGWCSQSRYRDVGRGNDTLNSDVLTLDLTRYCRNAAPVEGESYNFRVRAAYVWKNSGDTNPRNGPWKYNGPIVYNPPTYNQSG